MTAMLGARDAIADRFVRLSGRLVAVGYVADLVLVAPDLENQSRGVESWWTPFAIAVAFGPGLALGVLSFHRDPRWMRRAAVLAVVGYPVTLIAWLAAWHGVPLHQDQWLGDVPALAGLAAAVVWRARASLLALAVTAVAATVVNYTARAPEVNVPFVPDLLYAFSYSALFVAAVLVFIRTGRSLDTVQNDAFESSASSAALRSRAAERDRFAALTHDWVMSTLLAAARGADRDAVRRQAMQTLNYLDDLEHPFGRVLDAPAVVYSLRAAVAHIEPDLPIAVVVDRGAERWGFPAAAVSVTAAAAGEAVRNSMRHAGSDAHRRVDIRVDGGGFRVAVIDDGVGFDTAVERPDRLGIALSIHARMRQLGGGTSSIVSRPGAGTTVRLSWAGPMAERHITPDTCRTVANSPTPLSMRTLLGMRTRAAWVTVAFFLAAYAASLAATPVLFSQPWPMLACLVLTAAAGGALLAVPGDPPPLGASLAILTAGGPAQYAIVCAVASMSDNTTVQEWSLGCATAVCVFMCMRGRVVLAWLTMVVLLAEFAVRMGLPTDASHGFAVPFLYLAPLLAATFFARIIGPVASTTLDLREETLHRIAAQAADAAAVAERDRQLHRLGRLTRPLLELLASFEPVDGVRDVCALQEAELRDALRAPQLAHPPVVIAARAARRRGVEVVLYDEHGLDDLDAAVGDRAREQAVAEIQRARDGSVIVRIQRPGRRPLLTIVADGSAGTRRIELDEHAHPLRQDLEV
ncbi:ATP-binding protein [Nocardia sp. NEAU-G5]|uniref:ATP-binding protein n=2 Tax=Nocardia albiluteola TaxID=2842303 RepID=A0ABS6B5J3_9NOCA|nr:ATP-binding protein [Nocardia albiluteola]MBU3065585.1 ATP-binding protein [Nocardia albiluteola]